jgi:hypothetical protein
MVHINCSNSILIQPIHSLYWFLGFYQFHALDVQSIKQEMKDDMSAEESEYMQEKVEVR